MRVFKINNFIHFTSCNMKLNLDYLVEKIWEHLNLIKVFTKKRGRNCFNTKKTQLIY